MKRTTKVNRAVTLVIAIVALCGATSGLRASETVYSGFDSGLGGWTIQWAYGGIGYYAAEWDSAVDSRGNPNSGSIRVTANWANSTNWQALYLQRAAAFDLSGYKRVSFDLKVDPASLPSTYGHYGLASLWLRGPGWSTEYTALTLILGTGWVHVEGVIPPSISSLVGMNIGFEYAGFTGPITYWVDNVVFSTSSGTIVPGQFVAETTQAEGAYSDGNTWGDYDNDGNIDLFVAIGAGDGAKANSLYRNNGSPAFTFSKKTLAEVGVIASDLDDSWGCSWADANNDGWLDLFVINGWVSTNYDRLYLNTNGVFTSVNAGALTSNPRTWNASACWLDYNNDGFADVFNSSAYRTVGQSNALFMNNGDGNFTRILQPPIGTGTNDANMTACGDYNNDGKTDVLVINYELGVNNALYRNDGNGQFTSVTNDIVVSPGGREQCLTAVWGDYDNDGDLDVALGHLWSGMKLFRNDGNDRFTLVATYPAAFWSFGIWLDYDNDGDLDLYTVHGQNYSMPNCLYRNNGDGTFSPVTDQVSSDLGYWCVGTTADYNNDGFMDLFVTERFGNNALYRNQGNANHWIKFKLEGVASNRAAIGAKVRVTATIGGKKVTQMREISGGSIGQDDLRPNFGLGDATVVEKVRVEWPSGRIWEATNAPANQILSIKEPGPTLKATKLADGKVAIEFPVAKSCKYDLCWSSSLPTAHGTNSFVPQNTGTYSTQDAGTEPRRFFWVEEKR